MSKLVIITGVGKGFGRVLARALLEDYIVLGISRSEVDLQTLTEELADGDNCFYSLRADVSKFDDTRRAIQKTIRHIGIPVYGVINNAGVRCRKAFEDLDIEDYLRVAETNLFGAINIIKTTFDFIESDEGGRIINVSSILSQRGLADLSAYAVSKGGLDAFTRSMAVEMAEKNVTFNSILPGFCKTSYYPNFVKQEDLHQMTISRTPMRRWGEEDEPVGLCKFLLSAEAGYITGTSIPIDGGWLAA